MQDTHVRLWDLRTEQCQGLLKAPGPPCAEFDQQVRFCSSMQSLTTRALPVLRAGQAMSA